MHPHGFESEATNELGAGSLKHGASRNLGGPERNNSKNKGDFAIHDCSRATTPEAWKWLRERS